MHASLLIILCSSLLGLPSTVISTISLLGTGSCPNGSSGAGGVCESPIHVSEDTARSLCVASILLELTTDVNKKPLDIALETKLATQKCSTSRTLLPHLSALESTSALLVRYSLQFRSDQSSPPLQPGCNS